MALATVEDLATYLRKDLDAADAATALQDLDAASAIIERYCTRVSFTRVTNDVVKLRGSYESELQLPGAPVVSVSQVVVDGDAVTDYSIVRDHLIRTGFGGFFTSPRSLVGHWGGTSVEVQVTYTHGFATVPDEVRVVCIEVAKRAFENPAGIARDDLNTASQWLGLTAENRAVLARYRLSTSALTMS